MDSVKLMKELSQHPVVLSELSMQMQLGLPYLRKRKGKLCVGFRPHREEFVNGSMEFYGPQYELEFVYPFKKVVHFSNLSLMNEVDVSKPVCRIEGAWMADNGKRILDKLYEACTRVLTFQEEDGKISDVSVSKYQKAYWKAVEELGLSAVYGSEEQ